MSLRADECRDWYHEAQHRRYEYGAPSGARFDDSILEEDEDGIESSDERPASAPVGPQDTKTGSNEPASTNSAQEDASKALRQEELFAFAGCFLGPLLGAVLLHTIRGQLTRAEGIVSNFNLGIFFLGAEIRPFRRLIKMRKERIWHLQRIVRSSAVDGVQGADAEQVQQRLADLEARLDGPTANSEVDISKLSAEMRQSTQLQLDALNRAVRRYEKRNMAQTLQIEARFQELGSRLKDALALAAAAARTGQRPGMMSTTITWLASLINSVVQTAWIVATYPLRTVAAAISMVKSLLFKDERQSRRRVKGSYNGHSTVSTPRMQPKTGR